MLNELILEQINNGEISLEKAYNLYGKDDVDEGLENLRKSNEEILSKYSVEDMRIAVEKKVLKNGVSGGKSSSSKFKLPSVNAMKYIGIAAVFVMAVGIFTINQTGTKSYSRTGVAVRAKGNKISANKDSRLILYKQTENGAMILSSGDKACSGDVIQISYNAGSFNYGIIFSVDGNRNVTKHFPENEWISCSLSKEEKLLDFSYELDDAPSFENFIFLSSKESFVLSESDAYKIFSDPTYLKEKFPKVQKTEVLLKK